MHFCYFREKKIKLTLQTNPCKNHHLQQNMMNSISEIVLSYQLKLSILISILYLPTAMLKTVLFFCILTIILAEGEVVFKTEGNSITFHADWHLNIKDLQQQFKLFNQNVQQTEMQTIDVSFAYCSDHPYILENLFASNFNAKHISINLDSCRIGNRGLLKVLTKIEGKTTESLKLVLNSVSINDDVLGVLGEKLSTIPLKKLSIEIVFNKIGDNGLTELFSHPLSKEIEDLQLDFTFNKLGHKSLTNLPNFLQNINSEQLKRLIVKLGSNKIEQKGAQQIYEALQRFQNLEQLQLDFYFNNIKAKGTKHISQLVNLQPNLKKLSLNYDMNYIETDGGIAVSNSLKPLKLLTELDISVANKNFGYNGFQAIAVEIGLLKHLKSLTFKADVNRVGLKGAQKVSQAINKLNLEYLNLGFTQNFISDEGIQVISETISKQKGIKIIKLNLGFNEARGYGPISLLKVLEANQYDEIWLGLSNNPLEDAEVKLFLPLIQHLIMKTQKFEFEFLNTKISQQLARQVQDVFDKARQNNLNATLHISNAKQSERIRDELQKQNQKLELQNSKATDL